MANGEDKSKIIYIVLGLLIIGLLATAVTFIVLWILKGCDCSSDCPVNCSTSCPVNCSTSCPVNCASSCPVNCSTACPVNCSMACPYQWTGIPSADTLYVLPLGSTVTLYHPETGRYVSVDSSGVASASATSSSGISTHFLVVPGSSYPGAVKLQSQGYTAANVNYLRISQSGSTFNFNSQGGGTATYSDVYALPPSGATSALSNGTSMVLYSPASLQGNPGASGSYPYFSFDPTGKAYATSSSIYTSPDSQLAIVVLN
jgi:hypothetical protein